MLLSKYEIKARIAPAAICAIPFLIFYYWYLSLYISDMLSFLGNIKIVGNISFSILIVILFSQINRHLSKAVFQKFYFKDELLMPTTDFLLYSDTQYTDDYKNNFREKISHDFGIVLPDKKEESDNELFARKRIAESMSRIRKKCEDSKLLLQHNIEYGFFRNLIGGSVIAAPLSLFFSVYCYMAIHNMTATALLIACFIIFSLFVIFSKNLINEHGRAYAKILFQEYIAK